MYSWLAAVTLQPCHPATQDPAHLPLGAGRHLQTSLASSHCRRRPERAHSPATDMSCRRIQAASRPPTRAAPAVRPEPPSPATRPELPACESGGGGRFRTMAELGNGCRCLPAISALGSRSWRDAAPSPLTGGEFKPRRATSRPQRKLEASIDAGIDVGSAIVASHLTAGRTGGMAQAHRPGGAGCHSSISPRAVD